jgi:hypothetical protein
MYRINVLYGLTYSQMFLIHVKVMIVLKNKGLLDCMIFHTYMRPVIGLLQSIPYESLKKCPGVETGAYKMNIIHPLIHSSDC